MNSWVIIIHKRIDYHLFHNGTGSMNAAFTGNVFDHVSKADLILVR